MNKLLIGLLAVLLSGCATRQQGQVTGAAVGAAIGSQVMTPGNSPIGAAAGAAIGSVIGGDLSRQPRYDHRPPPRVERDPYAVCNKYYHPHVRQRCIQDIWYSLNHK